MSSFSHLAVISLPVRRPVLWAALTGAVMLVSPLLPAYAQTATSRSTQQSHAAQRAETVDQRIAYLHAELKITPAEEPVWQTVAQTMRDNAAAMQKIVAEKASQSEQGMTAIEDLKTYTEFAQAHVDGLKNLTASFQTLYDSMPAPQKKLADQVFQSSRHQQAHPPS